MRRRPRRRRDLAAPSGTPVRRATLAEGPALEVGEQDGGALGGRQLLDEHDLDPLGHGGGDRGLLGLRGSPGRAPWPPGSRARSRTSARRRRSTERWWAMVASQARSRPPVGVEHPRPLPEVEEDLLGDVLGGRAVAGDLCREAVDHGRELLVASARARGSPAIRRARRSCSHSTNRGGWPSTEPGPLAARDVLYIAFERGWAPVRPGQPISLLPP